MHPNNLFGLGTINFTNTVIRRYSFWFGYVKFWFSNIMVSGNGTGKIMFGVLNSKFNNQKSKCIFITQINQLLSINFGFDYVQFVF